MRSSDKVPLSSQSSVRGILVTIRWSGFKLLAFHLGAEFTTIGLKCLISRITVQVPPSTHMSG